MSPDTQALLNKIAQTETTRQCNFMALEAYCNVLETGGNVIDTNLMDRLVKVHGFGTHEAMTALLTAAMTAGSDDTFFLMIVQNYVRNGLSQLNAQTYTEDLFVKSIHLPQAQTSEWEFYTLSYQPFEPFIWRDITIDNNFTETPQVGYFSTPFSCPAIRQGGQEWMSVKPNEVETMRLPIEQAHGKVLTLGLGLGYFTFMAAIKPQVESVTVVERDPGVIKLFREHILPQMACRDKIRIIESDALQYMEHGADKEKFDFCLADLWHDASDGVPLYLRLKPLERLWPGTLFAYWIEETLISHLRWLLFYKIEDTADTSKEEELYTALAATGLNIKTPEDLTQTLMSRSIATLARNGYKFSTEA